MEILAYHGWGFTASCWQSYSHACANILPLNINWKSFDRGYFGTPQDIAFSTETAVLSSELFAPSRIVVAHSYGLHYCPASVLDETDLLILMNSFLTFHGTESRLQTKSQRKLERMIQAFVRDPWKTWANFMSQTFLPDPLPLRYDLRQDLEFDCDRLNQSLLAADLEALNTLSPTQDWIDRLARIPQILIVTSPADHIVSNPLQPAQLPHRSVQEILLPAGGHGAPFVQTDGCLTKIFAAIGFDISPKAIQC